MNAHRLETTLTEKGTLTLTDLPFAAGARVEVIVMEHAATSSGDSQNGEAEAVSDWLAASQKSLREVWDNDDDAVYDHL